MTLYNIRFVFCPNCPISNLCKYDYTTGTDQSVEARSTRQKLATEKCPLVDLLNVQNALSPLIRGGKVE